MDVTKMLSELREQRTKLDRLIMAAEHYASSGARRRGRPPEWRAIKRRGRPPGSKNKSASTLVTKAG
jgi:hypothetical protein